MFGLSKGWLGEAYKVKLPPSTTDILSKTITHQHHCIDIPIAPVWEHLWHFTLKCGCLISIHTRSIGKYVNGLRAQSHDGEVSTAYVLRCHCNEKRSMVLNGYGPLFFSIEKQLDAVEIPCKWTARSSNASFWQSQTKVAKSNAVVSSKVMHLFIQNSCIFDLPFLPSWPSKFMKPLTFLFLNPHALVKPFTFLLLCLLWSNGLQFFDLDPMVHLIPMVFSM